jgi:Fe2+ transport system protein FeoA
MQTTLDKLQPGDEAVVVEMHGEDETLNRLMELGLIEGTPLKLLRFAPLGDPLEIVMRGYHLSLRRHEAAGILVDTSV